MGEFVAAYVLPLLAVVTYGLQLWTGFAVAGVSGDNVLIDRRQKPGPYWFVMGLQTLILVGAPLAMALGDWS